MARVGKREPRLLHKGRSRSIKSLLRKSVVEEMRRREANSIKEFVEIWYSEETWANLQKIKIY